MHRLYLFLFVLLFSTLHLTAQPDRRANYFETYVEVNKPIDSIVVHKHKREMITFHQGEKVKMYMISLGMEPKGKKEFEGDMRTPEGLYTIKSRDTISSYHTNLAISYPSISDSMRAVSKGKKPGGDIKIHGFPNNHRKIQEAEFLNTDWTAGCIAVSDYEVDELYRWVIENCPILILP